NRPVRISNLQQFRNRFGNPRSDGYLAYAVEGFFLNGGQEAFINRVVGAGSVTASAVLNNRVTPTAGAALRVAAGYRGQEEPGEWGGRLRLDVRDDPKGRTQLSAPATAGLTSAQLQSLSGFQIGSVVRLANGADIAYRKITAIDPLAGTISWAAASPLTVTFPASTTQVSSAEFRLVVWSRPAATVEFDVVEEWP